MCVYIWYPFPRHLTSLSGNPAEEPQKSAGKCNCKVGNQKLHDLKQIWENLKRRRQLHLRQRRILHWPPIKCWSLVIIYFVMQQRQVANIFYSILITIWKCWFPLPAWHLFSFSSSCLHWLYWSRNNNAFYQLFSTK